MKKMKVKNIVDCIPMKYTIVIFLVFICSFILIKNEFYYNIFNSIPSYISYYINEYLNGDSSLFFINNDIYMYIEPQYKYIMSSLYLFAIIQNVLPIKIIYYLLPFIIFFKNDMVLQDEIYNKAMINKIVRIGKKKYCFKTIIHSSLIWGLVFMLPKLLFLLLLMIMFPNGYSFSLFLDNTSFFSESYLYIAYGLNPYLIIIIDLLMPFLYGIFVSNISILVSTLTDKKIIKILMFVFLLFGSSIICVLLGAAPLISYYSFFSYFETLSNLDSKIFTNDFFPLVTSFTLVLFSFAGTLKLMFKGVRKNL